MSLKKLLSFLFLLTFALSAYSGPPPQPALQPAAGADLYLPLLLQADPPPATQTPEPGTNIPEKTVTPSPTVVAPTLTLTPTPTPTATNTPSPTPTETSTTFAVIGDYGTGTQAEADVATLVDSWNVEFIITVGDNNYPYGKAETIDDHIGQFYSNYIHPYQGSYGSSANTNRFFPALGNHDHYSDSTQNNPQPYLDYFTLPGNERYYHFTWENVDFFVLNSYWMEPDRVTPGSKQYIWLQDQLALSASDWQVVYFHDAIFSSSLSESDLQMDWPFKDWGVDLILTGHVHNYERLKYNGLTYVVNGLGGDEREVFRNPLPYSDPASEVQSLARFNKDFGAMLVTVDSTGFHAQFIDRNGLVHDSFVIP